MVGAQIAAMRDGWARNVPFSLLSYDEAHQLDSKVDSWMPLTENAARDAHSLILEDGPAHTPRQADFFRAG
jgi:hypothetical protein